MDAFMLALNQIYEDIDLSVDDLTHRHRYVNVYEYTFSDKLIAYKGKFLSVFIREHMQQIRDYAQTEHNLHIYFSQIHSKGEVYYKLIISNDRYAKTIHPELCTVSHGFKSKEEMKQERMKAIQTHDWKEDSEK